LTDKKTNYAEIKNLISIKTSKGLKHKSGTAHVINKYKIEQNQIRERQFLVDFVKNLQPRYFD
jgi:hypothetical protein